VKSVLGQQQWTEISVQLHSHNFGCVGPIGVWPIGHETRLIMAHFC